jgi:hypothetical protein
MSYECGFLRGVSTIALTGPSKTRDLKTPIIPTLGQQNEAV